MHRYAHHESKIYKVHFAKRIGKPLIQWQRKYTLRFNDPPHLFTSLFHSPQYKIYYWWNKVARVFQPLFLIMGVTNKDQALPRINARIRDVGEIMHGDAQVVKTLALILWKKRAWKMGALSLFRLRLWPFVCAVG